MEEPDLEKDSIINNRFIIKRKIGEGSFSKVYLILDEEDKEKYAAKILLEKKAQKETSSFENEIAILKKLKLKPKIVKYVNQFHDSGIGDITKKGNVIMKKRYYLITTYFSKKNLFTYLDKTQEGFEEKYIKIIFSKILECFDYIHSKDICHLDIKLQNIMLDEHFIPIIIDFGLSHLMEKDKDNKYKPINDKRIRGTPFYISPQIWGRKKYSGIKADIFSLGVLLFFLATKNNSFIMANPIDDNYKLICKNNIDKFWSKLEGLYPKVKSLSPEFKDLFIKMISFKEEERPGSIRDIFSHQWMQEVNKFTKEDYSDYEKMMKDLEFKVLQDDETLESFSSKEDSNINLGSRSSGEDSDEEEFFNNKISPKLLSNTGLNAMNYIKIKGEISPEKFMNSLANKLKQELNCEIKAHDELLMFEATFPNKIREELENMEKMEDEEINMEEIEFKDCVIIIELFEFINGGYELNFNKGEGEFMDYYSFFQETKKIVKKILGK